MAQLGIIIPVYNVEKYFDRCIDSILSQTYQNFSVFLVDDGSTDNSGKICDEYALKDNRITVFHQENKGQAAARNFAIDYVLTNTDCEFITFIDSDDWITPQYFEIMMSPFIDSSIQISYCHYIQTSDLMPYETKSSWHFDLIDTEELWLKNPYNAPWGKIFRKELLTDLRFPEGIICEDAFWTYKILFSVDKIAYIDEKLYCYFTNPTGTMNSKWSLRRLDEYRAFRDQTIYFHEHNFRYAEIVAYNRYLFFLVFSMLNVTTYYPAEKKLYNELKRELRTLKKSFSRYNHKNEYCKMLNNSVNICVYLSLSGLKNELKNSVYSSEMIWYLRKCYKYYKTIFDFSSLKHYKDLIILIYPNSYKLKRFVRKKLSYLKEILSRS